MTLKSLCCTSPRALCYFGCAFLVFYAVGLALVFWLHFGRYELAVLFAALGLACVANLLRNRSFHCLITAPFFLLVALAFALNAAGVWKLRTGALWAIVVIVVCAAFLLESRFAS